MTVVAYALGRPRPAASRGGDCWALDLHQNLTVRGPHVFAAPTHCQIQNGMLRLTVGNVGSPPQLSVEVWRGAGSTVGDAYSDTYADAYEGDEAEGTWITMGTVVLDSPTALGLATGVRLANVSPEAVTIGIAAATIAGVYVTLRRGERHCRIQHGSTRQPMVETDRRVRWTASPSPVGLAALGRVEELVPAVDNLARYVGAIDPVAADAGTFSLTASSVTVARFGAGVGTDRSRDRTSDLHSQLGDASRPAIVVAA